LPAQEPIRNQEKALELLLEHQQAGAWTVVTVAGEIDMANADDLQSYLSSVAETHNLVALDLSTVTFIDSTGLNALIRTYRLLEPGGSLLVLAPSPQVSRVLEVTGLDRLFRISGSAEQPESLVPLPAPSGAAVPTAAGLAG
jgi:anti-sigma B factor antagonist